MGGGIEFLEKSEDALKREFMEEIQVDIIVKDFLGIAENIFTYEGKNAHELVLFYSIEIPEDQYKEEYIVEEEGKKDVAKWVSIDEFKSGKRILYPEEIFKYI